MTHDPRAARHPRHTRLTVLGLAAMALGACGGPANLVLRSRPGTPSGLGPLQRCERGETPCVTDPNQDGSRFNPSNTVFFSLPACANGIDRILVQHVDGQQPVAIVECAAPNSTPGSGIPETTSDGGTTN